MMSFPPPASLHRLNAMTIGTTHLAFSNLGEYGGPGDTMTQQPGNVLYLFPIDMIEV